jgi:hypothetical protein
MDGPSSSSSATAAAEALLRIPQVSWMPRARMQLADTSQKRFFRQRAHANVFSDHALE